MSTPLSDDVLTACAEHAADRESCRWILEGGPEPAVDSTLLTSIFSDPAFADARHRGVGALEQLLLLLRGWLSDFMGTSGAAGFASWTRTFVLGAAILLLLGVGLRWLWTRSRPPAPSPDDPLAHPLDAPLELPARHLARGHEALADRPREAIRQGLLALLSGLEDAGVIAPGRVRTNRELARALGEGRAASADVARLTELLAWYDAAFYSLAEVTTADARTFLSRIGDHLEGLSRSGAAA